MESLVLDGNALDALPEELMDMRLNRGFSARDNRITSVSTQPILASPGARTLSVATLVAVSDGEGVDTCVAPRFSHH